VLSISLRPPLAYRGRRRQNRRRRPCNVRPPTARRSAVRARLAVVEVERAAVDAVALPGRPGAVLEDVTQMPAAAAAHDLGATHEQAVVGTQLDGLGDRRLGEARPTGAGIELGVRREQRRTAAGTSVRAVLLGVPVGAGEGALGALPAQHVVLLRCQLPAPLLVALDDLLGGVHFVPLDVLISPLILGLGSRPFVTATGVGARTFSRRPAGSISRPPHVLATPPAGAPKMHTTDQPSTAAGPYDPAFEPDACGLA